MGQLNYITQDAVMKTCYHACRIIIVFDTQFFLEVLILRVPVQSQPYDLMYGSALGQRNIIF